MTLPPGSTDDDLSDGKMPARALLKRIDIGLTTGLLALLLSFVGILTSRATFKMNQETQKARVLPVIDIDMGYNTSGAPLTYTLGLENVGVGLADIRRLSVFVDAEPATGEEQFRDAVMSPRMAAWARTRDGEAVNYLRAGDRTTPIQFVIENAFQARAGEYFESNPAPRAEVEVCYCSAFDDCWTVRHHDRRAPQAVDSCGTTGAVQDDVQGWRDARIASDLSEEDTP